ncbi:hypothetical protein GA0070563_10185 [Micromonospora carbonacea]|uniref:Uncharacterized protein n=1 Tax=Micromonospora carbonacea TaxID=47853 RepID=A0A1C4TXX1_9ACTN|nr:hypothetical protein GA0070563_10185 [Micromonospora carbonacea]
MKAFTMTYAFVTPGDLIQISATTRRACRILLPGML